MPTFETYEQGTPCYVQLTTPDVAAAREFYGALFGWALTDISSGEEPDQYLSCAVEGDKVAGISCQMPEQAGHPAYWTVFLAVDDVDATVAGVPAAGGKVELEPSDVRDLGRMAAVQDPTGARFNLWEARSEIGTQRANEPNTPVWNELVSPDLPTATRFYAEILGVTWADSPMAEDSVLDSYQTMSVSGRAVAGALPPPMAGLPPHWNVYFNVADVDTAVAKAESLGGTAMAPAFDVPDVGRLAMLADPQGGIFWLMGASPEAA